MAKRGVSIVIILLGAAGGVCVLSLVAVFVWTSVTDSGRAWMEQNHQRRQQREESQAQAASAEAPPPVPPAEPPAAPAAAVSAPPLTPLGRIIQDYAYEEDKACVDAGPTDDAPHHCVVSRDLYRQSNGFEWWGERSAPGRVRITATVGDAWTGAQAAAAVAVIMTALGSDADVPPDATEEAPFRQEVAGHALAAWMLPHGAVLDVRAR